MLVQIEVRQLLVFAPEGPPQLFRLPLLELFDAALPVVEIEIGTLGSLIRIEL